MSQIEVHLVLSIEEDSLDAIVERIANSLQRKLENAENNQPEMTASQKGSKWANYGGTPPEDESLLVDNKQACKLLRVSERKLWQMWNSNMMPKPMKIGRVIRWSREELTKWVQDGCQPL